MIRKADKVVLTMIEDIDNSIEDGGKITKKIWITVTTDLCYF